MRRGGPRDQSINYYAINENKNKLKKIYKRNKKKKCVHTLVATAWWRYRGHNKTASWKKKIKNTKLCVMIIS